MELNNKDNCNNHQNLHSSNKRSNKEISGVKIGNKVLAEVLEEVPLVPLAAALGAPALTETRGRVLVEAAVEQMALDIQATKPDQARFHLRNFRTSQDNRNSNSSNYNNNSNNNN